MNTLIGVLTRAGTFPVRDQEVTGYVIETPRETLEAVPRLPMYRTVAIVDETDLTALKKCWQECYRDLAERDRMLNDERAKNDALRAVMEDAYAQASATLNNGFPVEAPEVLAGICKTMRDALTLIAGGAESASGIAKVALREVSAPRVCAENHRPD